MATNEVTDMLASFDIVEKLGEFRRVDLGDRV